MPFKIASFALLLSIMIALPASGASSPDAGIARLDQLPTPLPYPYDAAANASAQVDTAQTKAAAAGKLLLIDLGGNWCPDCRILAGVMALPAVKAFLEAHYEVVTVDVGRMNRNLEIPARFGVTAGLEGVPSLLVVDPKTGKLLDEGHVAALADARSETPQALADWLAQWVP